MTNRLDPALALLLAPALVGLALTPACYRPPPRVDPLEPYALSPAAYLGPATVCGYERDLQVCDDGWAYQCAPDSGGGCSWRTQGAPCRDEPEARGVVVPGGRCGPTK